MTTRPTLEKREKQPNPFALPPETHARFVLLVFAALSLTFLSGIVIAFALGLAQATPETTFAIPQSTDAGFLADTKTLSVANASFYLRRIALPFVMIVVILLVAIIRYCRHPERVCRQKELKPFEADKGRALEQEVLKMAAVIGLDPVPDIVSNPSPRSQEAQAYGLPNRYILRLDSRLRLMLLKMRGAFRALLLHEMGHIVNGDVGRYYFTEALWHATRFYALIPMTAVLSFVLLQAFGERLWDINNDWLSFFTRNLPTYLAIGLQVGVVWLISKAIRASVLRVREYYADARAALGGTRPGLRMILRPSDQTQSLWERLRGWWRLHPTVAERLATVNDPGQLFKFALDLPFLVGFLLAIVFFAAFALFGDLAVGLGSGLMAAVAGVVEMAEANPSYALLGLAFGLLILLIVLSATILFIPILAISYLMSNVLGLQLIRETLYDQVTGQVRPGRFRRLGLITLVWLLVLRQGYFDGRKKWDKLPNA